MPRLFSGTRCPSPARRPACGKSALAAHFCHLYRNSYEFICRIPCSDPSLIGSEVRRIAQELTQTEIPADIDPSGRFREALASHKGPWLFVFIGGRPPRKP